MSFYDLIRIERLQIPGIYFIYVPFEIIDKKYWQNFKNEIFE